MRLLPKADWTMEPTADGDHLIVCTHANGPKQDYRFYEKVRVSDLPNDLIGRDDLERLLVDSIDVPAVA